MTIVDTEEFKLNYEFKEYLTICFRCEKTFYCSESLEHLSAWLCPECEGWGGKPLVVEEEED